MTTEQFANNAQSTLAADITAISASLVVAVPSLFSTSPQFRIRIDSELMLVTAVSGATFTVTRGIEGTTAAPHSNGATVTQIVTAGAIAKLFQPNATLPVSVTGSRGGNAALASLLTALASIGLITDNTTA